MVTDYLKAAAANEIVLYQDKGLDVLTILPESCFII